MPVTPTEAEALQRSRIRASRGMILRRLPRDWTTPLALAASLVVALAAGIKHTTIHVVFDMNLHTVIVVATYVSLAWLIVCVFTTVSDANAARKDREAPVAAFK